MMLLEPIIYEEELDSYENELLMEKALIESNMYIDLVCFESSDDSSIGEKFAGLIHKIIEMFKAFINKCKDYLKSAISKITGRVASAYTEHKLRDLIKDFDKKLTIAERAGLKSFKSVDIEALYKCVDDEYNEFTDHVKKFVHVYIKRAAPKDAEKMVKKLQDISSKYDAEIRDIIDNPKEYSIREAKKLVAMLEKTKENSNGSFSDIAKKYASVCDEIERLTVNTLNSLKQYSEDTGYVQNAKTLQDIIRNSTIRLHTHSAECITVVLKYAIPTICHIDKIANTKNVVTGQVNKDGSDHTKKVDLSSPTHAAVRSSIGSVSEHLGSLSDIELKSIRKTSRSNDIRDWKYTKGESPLTFDKNPVSKEDMIVGSIKAAPKMAGYEVKKAVKQAYGPKAYDYVKKKAEESMKKMK